MIKLNLYNRDTKKWTQKEFESIGKYWEWHDIPSNSMYKAYNSLTGEVVYRIAICR